MCRSRGIGNLVIILAISVSLFGNQAWSQSVDEAAARVVGGGKVQHIPLSSSMASKKFKYLSSHKLILPDQ
jgi:hypothetical protein